MQSFSPTSHVCYFNLMYTSVQQESLPTTLQYFTNPDNYTYTLNVPTLSGSSQTATIKSEEEVGEITWINPAMQSSAVNVLDNSDTYFVFRVTKGTHLMANWTKDGVVTSAAFESSCPSAIATKYPTECSQANHRPYVFSSQLYKFLRSTGVSQNITVLVYNDLSLQKSKQITVNVLLPLSGLSVYLETPTTDNIVEIGSITIHAIVCPKFLLPSKSGGRKISGQSINGWLFSTFFLVYIL